MLTVTSPASAKKSELQGTEAKAQHSTAPTSHRYVSEATKSGGFKMN